MNQNNHVKIEVADPSALGLLGLAIVTLVASANKFGIVSGVSLVIPWAIFLGAFVQLIACLNDIKHGNVFGTTAFGGYAFFWFGMAMSWMIQLGVFGEAMKAAADPKAFGFVFIGYLIFTLYMTVGAVETNKTLLIIFILIDFLFIGLAGTTFGIAPHAMHTLAAVSEFAIAMMSFYGSAANVLNKTFEREFLPLGKPLGIFKK
ncbi:acetate uptake transporter [Cetobacterium sp. 2G large]|uniref:acetate uptake transporter n=1 Tax=Cetobacterium sp. 2G large TaxID=2759680 RepID=UPI00163C5CE4|nr:acetate uptake transporter [Cetobacterium sp. 2G large]MBC2852966.1 acetate uptake transporter [Cetobacterium sp. 2G large]